MAAVNFWTWAVWAPVLITLFSGTVSSLTNKVIYDTPIEGTCGKNKFQKAYFFTMCMFIGEWMCLGLYYFNEFMRRRKEAQGNSYQSLGEGLIGGGGGGGNGGDERSPPRLHAVNQLEPAAASFGRGNALETSSAGVASPDAPLNPVAAKKPPIWIYAVLCVFDLSATAVGGVGLIWVDASTNQMLRGSMVVFCAVFSVLLLKRRLSRLQWGAIGLVVIGLVLVGMSGMLKKHFDPPQTGGSAEVSSGQLMVGIFLVLLASALNAIQNVFEEKLLKAVGGAEVDPLELVGWEGMFGTLLSAFVLLPIVQHIPGGDCGKAEDTLNTLEQLGNSGLAVGCTIAYIIALAAMNGSSQQITQTLSSVHRNLVSAVRTVLVWVGSIILYYATESQEVIYGEEWNNWSLLELAGFFLLVGGTVCYSYAGILLAKQQAAAEIESGEFQKSPEYALPVDPTIGEHTQVIKQQSFRDRTSMQPAHGKQGGAQVSSYGYHQNVYDENQ